jgi:hypothetical protein
MKVNVIEIKSLIRSQVSCHDINLLSINHTHESENTEMPNKPQRYVIYSQKVLRPFNTNVVDPLLFIVTACLLIVTACLWVVAA